MVSYLKKADGSYLLLTDGASKIILEEGPILGTGAVTGPPGSVGASGSANRIVYESQLFVDLAESINSELLVSQLYADIAEGEGNDGIAGITGPPPRVSTEAGQEPPGLIAVVHTTEHNVEFVEHKYVGARTTQHNLELVLHKYPICRVTQHVIEVISPAGASIPMVVQCPDLSTVEVGQNFSTFVIVTGGAPPYHFSIVSGALPPGLFLNANTGEISGVPTIDGVYSFRLHVDDSGGHSAEVTCAITVTLPLCYFDRAAAISQLLPTGAGCTPTPSVGSDNTKAGCTNLPDGGTDSPDSGCSVDDF